jgi:hypothetical protein
MTNELKNTLELRKILKDATMVRIETQFATEIPGKNWNVIRTRNKDGDYKEFKFEELGVDSIALKLYNNKAVTDMWGIGYNHSRWNNIGLTVEDGTLSCKMKKEGTGIIINCSIESSD